MVLRTIRSCLCQFLKKLWSCVWSSFVENELEATSSSSSFSTVCESSPSPKRRPSISAKTPCSSTLFQIETVLDSKFARVFTERNDPEFWGIGLENECYLLSSKKRVYETPHAIRTRWSRERYSVNYLENYPIDSLRERVLARLSHQPSLAVPQLMNAHCFTRMDHLGQPVLTYTHDPQPNPKFCGKTIFDQWVEHDPTINTLIHPLSKQETAIFFDGDSIEFVTENFYKATTRGVTEELARRRQEFLERFNQFCAEKQILAPHLPFSFVSEHPGLAAMMTQPHRLVPFNNTTFHVHLTLPTALHNGRIVDIGLFQRMHQRAITLLQWFEPFFVSRLGSPDFLSVLFPSEYAGGSMRCAMSRYIGVGTYNPIDMQTGTLQTCPIDSVRPPAPIYWWRDQLEHQTQYIFPKHEIGVDIHYAKHFQCGIELRWFDGFPLDSLKRVLDLIVLISTYAQQIAFHVHNVASRSQPWNDVVSKSILHGHTTRLSKEEQKEYLRVLQLQDLPCEAETDWESFSRVLFTAMDTRLSKRSLLTQLSPDFKIEPLPCVNEALILAHRHFLGI